MFDQIVHEIASRHKLCDKKVVFCVFKALDQFEHVFEFMTAILDKFQDVCLCKLLCLVLVCPEDCLFLNELDGILYLRTLVMGKNYSPEGALPKFPFDSILVKSLREAL